MSKFREPKDRLQVTLLPRTVDEYVAERDLVRYVDCLADEFDLSAIESQYSEKGRHAYSPRVLVKLLIYGKMRRIVSSRELARATHENLRFIFLAGGERPDFRTISDFRKRFAPELANLLRQTVRIGVEEGLIDLQTVAVDGTIIRASAGAGSFRSKEQLEELIRKLDPDFAKDAEKDAVEGEEPGDGDDDHCLPEDPEERNELLSKARRALKEYEERPKDAKPLKQVSLTDPESRFIESSTGGRTPSYNAQAALDTKSRMAVSGHVTKAPSDGNELPRILEEIAENTGQNPQEALADRGYHGFDGLRELEERRIIGYIPQPKDRSSSLPRESFRYEESEQAYRCPNGKLLRLKHRQTKKRLRVYVCEECAGCPLASQCLQPGAQRRTFSVSDDDGLKQAMKRRTQTEEGRKKARLRSSTIELLFAHLKFNRGLRHFLVRGLKTVECAWRFTLAVHNIEVLIRNRRLKAA